MAGKATNKRRPYRVQEPPYCIQIELNEGCNLRCSFCGLQGIRAEKEKNYKCMEESTLRTLMRKVVALQWNPRIEFAMHGEPTMHPDYVGMIRACREEAPRLQIMMTSNAGGLLRKPGPLANVVALFEAGLNVLALDNYDGANLVPKVREAIEKNCYVEETDEKACYHVRTDKRSGEYMFRMYDYPDNPHGTPHARRPRGSRILSIVRDITQATSGNHATLTNHAGCGGPSLTEPVSKRCAKPFREIGVRWDGNVAMCCNDWRGHHKCGNVVTDELDKDIWNGTAMGAAREKLYAAERDFGPCAKCDFISYRNGLLPDKFGKDKMHRPDAQTDADIKRALAGDPYSKPVLRPWELNK